MTDQTDQIAAEPVSFPPELHPGTGWRSPKNHALCYEAIVIAEVYGRGFPVGGTGWHHTTEEITKEIAHRYNTQPVLLEALEAVEDALHQAKEYGFAEELEIVREAIARGKKYSPLAEGAV